MTLKQEDILSKLEVSRPAPDQEKRDEEDVNNPFSLVLLVKNETGYKNLTRLISRAYIDGQHLGMAMVEYEWLNRETAEGLIALSGAADGDIGRALVAGNDELAMSRLDNWLAVFTDSFYLELQRTGHAADERCVYASVKLASKNRCRWLLPTTYDF